MPRPRRGHPPKVAEAAERAEAARARLAKLARGEKVDGGLGKRLDIEAMFKAAGFTPSTMRRAELVASLTKAEFETLLDKARMKRRIPSIQFQKPSLSLQREGRS